MNLISALFIGWLFHLDPFLPTLISSLSLVSVNLRSDGYSSTIVCEPNQCCITFQNDKLCLHNSTPLTDIPFSLCVCMSNSLIISLSIDSWPSLEREQREQCHTRNEIKLLWFEVHSRFLKSKSITVNGIYDEKCPSVVRLWKCYDS